MECSILLMGNTVEMAGGDINSDYMVDLVFCEAKWPLRQTLYLAQFKC